MSILFDNGKTIISINDPTFECVEFSGLIPLTEENNRLKRRCEAMNRALKENADERCYTCNSFSVELAPTVYSTQEACTSEYPCEDGACWEFSEERFSE